MAIPAAPGLRETKNTAIGAWLIIAYIFTIGTSILVLGSYQIQSRIKTVEISGSKVSIWRLDAMSQYLDSRRTEQRAAEVDLEGLRAERAEVHGLVKSADKNYDEHFKNFRSKAAEFEAEFTASHPEFLFTYKGQAASANVDTVYNRLKADLARGNVTLSDEESAKVAELGNIAAEGLGAYKEVNSIKARRNALDREIKTLDLERIEKEKEIRIGVLGIDDKYADYSDSDKAMLQDAVSEFSDLKTSFYGVLYRLALVPAELLVLFLVLAMGALGSTIFITQVFFRQSQENFGIVFYYSRPIFGATIALSIFVLAKAGVLFLTDTSEAGSRAALSPFFISFIAIISGLMSEQAILTIRRSGERWFRQQQQGEYRWAVNVSAQIKEKKRDIASFSSTTGVDEETLNSWFNQEKPVPLDMQYHIAAWLETKPQALFTDIAPDNSFMQKKTTKDKTAVE